MSRRHAREAALLTLFQREFDQDRPPTVAAGDLASDAVAGLTEKDLAYANGLVQGTCSVQPEIDAVIERMAPVDRNLIRMAYYEMCYQEERIDPPIAINEAVELAKKYGSDDAGRYVNGILAALQKSMG